MCVNASLNIQSHIAHFKKLTEFSFVCFRYDYVVIIITITSTYWYDSMVQTTIGMYDDEEKKIQNSVSKPSCCCCRRIVVIVVAALTVWLYKWILSQSVSFCLLTPFLCVKNVRWKKFCIQKPNGPISFI